MHQGQQNAPDIRNLILAVVLSTLILLGWQWWVEEPKRQAAMEQAAQEQPVSETVLPDTTAEALGLADASAMGESRESRIASSARVTIDSPRLHGSINLQGMRIDDVTLANYRESVEEDSDEVVLLSPANGKDAYFAEFGWLPSGDVKTPTSKTNWKSTSSSLTPDTPLQANWTNGQGVRFEKTVSLDKNYMFSVRQKIENNSGKAITVFPYGLISRSYEDTGDHYYILHEGPLGVFNQQLEELGYEDLRDDEKASYQSKDGWLGITDKYWLSAIVPSGQDGFKANFQYFTRNGADKYQTDYLGQAITIQPGESKSVTNYFFAGAKEVSLLDHYAQNLEIPLFDRAVDFGMLYFLTKPIFHALDYFHNLLGNFGLAIMLLTVCIKIVLFPLANKSYRSMSQMKVHMPKIQEIRERYADDRVRMNQEMMEFYKREKVNPASGCLPMLLQIPIFFALYKVLFVTIEMRHAPFYGWIEDLSASDPTNIFTLFGLVPWEAPQLFHIGAWPLIMCVTMILQQRLNPKPTDPMQAAIMNWLPFIFLVFFAGFPAGLVIYWAWNNLLSITQQWVITRETRAQMKAA
ncbi:MAG: membrane protein insertase YidC [Rickettsiales bacterium]|nr:membrane protein insertase YidC [Rickettsiales bacterium]